MSDTPMEVDPPDFNPTNIESLDLGFSEQTERSGEGAVGNSDYAFDYNVFESGSFAAVNSSGENTDYYGGGANPASNPGAIPEGDPGRQPDLLSSPLSRAIVTLPTITQPPPYHLTWTSPDPASATVRPLKTYIDSPNTTVLSYECKSKNGADVPRVTLTPPTFTRKLAADNNNRVGAQDQSRLSVMPPYGLSSPRRAQSTGSSAAEVSFSSDKENNNHAQSGRRVSGTKRGAAAMSVDSTSRNARNEADSQTESTPRISKRKRTGLSDRDEVQATPRHRQRSQQTPQAIQPSQDAVDQSAKRAGDARYYDPDQPMSERRAVRKDYRELQKDLNDSRGDYLAADSTGIRDTIKRANEIFQNVKQTSEATLDSRLLVQAGDLGAKRAAKAEIGGIAAGVNVDDFVSKMVAFMRRGPTEEMAEQVYGRGSSQLAAAQNRAGATRGGADSDDDDDDDTNQLDWEWFGRAVTYPNSRRPGLPTFLLGPLSVQKKARKATQRTQRQRLDPRDAIRPDELDISQIERNDSKDLTAMCRMIMDLLHKTQKEGIEAVEASVTEEMEPDEVYRIMEDNAVRQDGGVCFFKFAFNPHSFGQTVENLFYICFLLRDGRVGIGEDEHRMLSIQPTQPSNATQIAEQNIKRNQGVFHLDHEIWEKLCKAYNIKGSIIPHRETHEASQNPAGWYG